MKTSDLVAIFYTGSKSESTNIYSPSPGSLNWSEVKHLRFPANPPATFDPAICSTQFIWLDLSPGWVCIFIFLKYQFHFHWYVPGSVWHFFFLIVGLQKQITRQMCLCSVIYAYVLIKLIKLSAGWLLANFCIYFVSFDYSAVRELYGWSSKLDKRWVQRRGQRVCWSPSGALGVFLKHSWRQPWRTKLLIGSSLWFSSWLSLLELKGCLNVKGLASLI